MAALPHPLRPVADAVDAETVTRAATGDVDAFERIYRTYVSRVHSLARRMAGPSAADELTQDVFVRVWRKLGTFRGDSAFGTWLHRLAVNVIVERFRSEAARRQRLIGGDRVSAAAVSVSHAERIGLEAALERLPDGARRVLVLHDVEGYKHAEIARLLSISAGTSKAQLHRARMLMRQHLHGA